MEIYDIFVEHTGNITYNLLIFKMFYSKQIDCPFDIPVEKNHIYGANSKPEIDRDFHDFNDYHDFFKSLWYGT